MQRAGDGDKREFECTSSDRGHFARWISLTGDTLTIEGVDSGADVERFWGKGLRFYEFVREVSGPALAHLCAALGCAQADLVDVLFDRFAPSTHDIELFLEERGIDSSFFNWIN